MSQEAVAYGSGLAVSTYSRIEGGKVNPTWTTVRGILRALDATVGDLAVLVDRRR